MASLHLTRVAFGADDVDVLRARLSDRAVGGETHITTRYRPTRHIEMVGGSLYWIIRHRLVARSGILGFDIDEEGKCRIRLSADLVPVRGTPKRAHQGWRYLSDTDAPVDLGGGEAEGIASLPHAMAAELAALALI